jgi:two-component system cell cycle sensor histidine kinase/response regulator CckA
VNIVLVVDDQAPTRTFIRAVLERHGWRVLEASDDVSAVEELRNAPEPVTVALIDIDLPGRGGSEIAKSLQSQQEVPVLFMSGYNREDLIARDKLPAGAPMLSKPFTVQSLLSAIESRIPPDRR